MNIRVKFLTIVVICFTAILLTLTVSFERISEPSPTHAGASSYCRSLPARGLGALGNPTGRPLGGGEGYGAWMTIPPKVVDNWSDLIEALRNADPGDVVYVDDSAEIDLTGEWEIPVKSGVTLASGRGRNGSLGALLFTTDEKTSSNRALLKVVGPDARITGLRLRGPNSQFLPPNEDHDSRGIEISAGTVEVDNNDIWNWPRSGILARSPQDVYIHHNYIHHTSRLVQNPDCDWDGVSCGIAYGVSLGNGFALIEANIFSHNRHAVNGGGPETEYEARYNLILDGGFSHPFDMHPFCPYEAPAECSATCLWPDSRCLGYTAGRWIVIHQNTVVQADHPAVKIRAKPTEGAEVYCNHFRGPADKSSGLPPAVAQTNVPSEYQMTKAAHMYVFDNVYRSDLLPSTRIRFDACCGWSGKYLGINEVTGQLILLDDVTDPRTRWHLTQSNDVTRIQTLAKGTFFEWYLDISTTSGNVKFHDDPGHTGTKWDVQSQNGFSRIISLSSGDFNGWYLDISTTTGSVKLHNDSGHTGTRRRLEERWP